MTVRVLPSVNSIERDGWENLRSPRGLYETPRWLSETESVIPGTPLITGEFDNNKPEALIIWRILKSDDPSPYFNIGGLLARLDVISRLAPGGWTLNCAGMEMHSQILAAPHIEITPDRLQRHIAAAIASQGTPPVMCGVNFMPLDPVRGLPGSLARLGFQEIKGYRHAILEIEGDSFEDYLGSLTKKQRWKVRSERNDYAANGYRTSISCGPDAFGDDLIYLHRLNRSKHGGPDDIQELRELHSRLARCGGANCVVLRTFLHDSCVGFSLFIRSGTSLHAMATGFEKFDSKVGPYFANFYYSAVEWAYQNGVKEIDYGIGATLAKSERGCRIADVSTWYQQ